MTRSGRERLHRALDAAMNRQQQGMRKIHKDLLRANLQTAWSTVHTIYKEDGTGAFNDVLSSVEEALSALAKVPNK